MFSLTRRLFQAAHAAHGCSASPPYALKNAVEVERGETADAGQSRQREFAVEMLRDVVEHAIDPVVIVLVAPHHASRQYVQPNRPSRQGTIAQRRAGPRAFGSPSWTRFELLRSAQRWRLGRLSSRFKRLRLLEHFRGRLGFPRLTDLAVWNNIVITMRAVHVSIRQIGNSQGVVIPKPVLAQLGLDRKAGAEMTIEDGALVLRRPASPARTGWAEAARRIAEAGDDELVMGEFGNAEDSELVW